MVWLEILGSERISVMRGSLPIVSTLRLLFRFQLRYRGRGVHFLVFCRAFLERTDGDPRSSVALFNMAMKSRSLTLRMEPFVEDGAFLLRVRKPRCGTREVCVYSFPESTLAVLR